MNDNQCRAPGCRGFLDERSSMYCTNHLIAALLNQIAELQGTRQRLENLVVALNRLVAEALEADRL